MKRLVLIILIVVAKQFCYSQEWIKIFGSYSFKCFPKYVTEYYDKGYILLGDKTDGKRGWIIKTDINGNLLWDKKIGNGYYLIGSGNIELTHDNGLIYCGTIYKYQNQPDAFLMKFSSCGILEWCSVFYTPDITDDGAIRVKETPDKGFVLLGEFNTPSSVIRINLFKFDSLGAMIWHKYFLPDSLAFEDDCMNMLLDSSGILITGYCYYPDPGQPGGWSRPYYLKSDFDGNELWSTIYIDNGYYHGDAWSSLNDKFGNYYSAVRHYGDSGDSPAVIKLNNNGGSVFNIDLTSNTSLGAASTIDIQFDTNLVVGGSWLPFNGAQTSGLFKTDTFGNIRKIKELPSYINQGYSSAQTFDNKIVYLDFANISGVSKMALLKFNSNVEYDSIYTYPYVYDSLCPGGVVSDTIDPDCDLIVNIEEPFKDPETTQLKVFPNPSNEKVTVELPKYLTVKNSSGAIPTTTIYHQWKSTVLEIYNLSGKKVFEKEIIRAQSSIEIDVSKWQSGMYYFRLMYNNQMVAGDKFIIQ